ncbi:TonB family protein [Candidatus Sororendozoicomonas aggregata]|uniref:energy transducer TonB n=1 Tax=Candidatus Sororendozoicomonas aggregata TaxID=3073239 RepID=UPI002ED640DF
MSKTLLLTLIFSIAAHLGVGWYLNKQEIIPDMTTGSLKAPVSVTFSTVTMQAQPEQQTAEPEPQPKPEPTPEPAPAAPPKKPLPKPVAKAEPVLRRQNPKPEKPVAEKVEQKKPPVKPAKKEVVKKTEEKPRKRPVEKTDKVMAKKELPAQPASVKSALKESKVEGLSNEPVLMTKPVVTNQVQPVYPTRYRRRNIEGAVNLELIVDETGHVIKVTILESSGFGLMDKSAIAAVRQWEFEPQKRNGLNVKSRLHQRIVFQLN